jgi:hypothetical protein
MSPRLLLIDVLIIQLICIPERKIVIYQQIKEVQFICELDFRVLLFLILYSKTEPVGFDRGPFYFEENWMVKKLLNWRVIKFINPLL